MTKEKVKEWEEKQSPFTTMLNIQYEAWEYFQDSLGKFFPKVKELPGDHFAMFKAGYITAKMEKK